MHLKSVLCCHYCFFVDEVFRFQPRVCDGCHDILRMSIDIQSITILNIHGIDYCCAINGIRKSEAIMLVKKMLFEAKNGSLSNIKIFFIMYKKASKKIISFGDIE